MGHRVEYKTPKSTLHAGGPGGVVENQRRGTFLVVQWLTLSSQCRSYIPSPGTLFYMPQLKIPHASMKTTNTDSLVAQMVKNPPAMWETWVPSLGWEDLLEEGMATYSSILVWRIPMDREAWWVTVHGVSKSWSRQPLSPHKTCAAK